VLALRDPAAHAAAMEEICHAYHPVFLRVLRHRGAANAEDLAQDFVVALLRNQALQRADPVAGRFRSYVRKMLENFHLRHLRDEGRQKRGGGAVHLELAEEHAATEAPGGELFDREWAREVLGRATASFRKAEKADPELLRMALGELVLREASGVADYAELSARLGAPASTLRSEATRIRDRFRDRLRQEVALTTVRSEIDGELKALFRFLLADGGS